MGRKKPQKKGGEKPPEEGAPQQQAQPGPSAAPAPSLESGDFPGLASRKNKRREKKPAETAGGDLAQGPSAQQSRSTSESLSSHEGSPAHQLASTQGWMQQQSGPPPRQQPQQRDSPSGQQPQQRGPSPGEQAQQRTGGRGRPQQGPPLRHGPPPGQQPQQKVSPPGQQPQASRGWGRGAPPQQQAPPTSGHQQQQKVSPPGQQPQQPVAPSGQQPKGWGRGPPQQQVPPGLPGSIAEQKRPPQMSGPPPELAPLQQPQAAGDSVQQLSQDVRTKAAIGDVKSDPASKKQKQAKGRPPQEEPVAPKPKEPITQVLDLAVPQRKCLSPTKKAGRPIKLETNHFALSFKKLDRAIHYDVAIYPDKPKKLLRLAVEAMRVKHYKNRWPAFDGVKNLYSAKPLPFGDEISDEVIVIEDEREKKYKVTIKFAAHVDLTSLDTYFGARSVGNRHLVTPQTAIQCLDVVFRNAPSLRCVPVGRSFFVKPRDQIIDLGEGMEMYYGFYQSTILGWKPFLNVDVAHKAFPKVMNVVDLIMELCRNCDVRRPLGSTDIKIVEKYLRMLKVQYEIPGHPGSKRVMRVNGLDESPARARFKLDNGPEMTVLQYFIREKGYNLRYPDMPCLWVGNKERKPRILLPAELCKVMDNQVTNRKMTEGQTTNMIRHAATSTEVRKRKIMTSVSQASYNTDPCIQEFGISIDSRFHQVDGRVLDPPSLTYDREVRPSRGVWRAGRFLTGIPLDMWTIICLDSRTREQALETLAEEMVRGGRPLGMNICPPQRPFLKLDARRAMQELRNNLPKYKNLQLIMVVIPEDKFTYNAVKQAAELIVGCLTQCVKSSTVFRLKPATVGNLLLKINAKLDGINHTLGGRRPRCLSRPCMIMGADVTHPSPDAKDEPSVAAVTASHDPKAFKYNICWRLQPPRQEIITDLEAIAREQLLYFYRTTKCKPEHIIFFRDGVSEGQFEIVMNTEVQAMRRACSSLQKDGNYKPMITFLVVQKRHHTRLFPTRPGDSEDKNFNVPAGTCVDTNITHPTALDFYLVSHASIQGVARPTKYRMLWDDADMQDEELEELTYHLCHMFTRCTRSVSYPAPTYYAHLAAARAKVYCENKPINLNNLENEQRQLTILEEIVKGKPMFFV